MSRTVDAACRACVRPYQELGCHATIRSFDPAALGLFRTWLRSKYTTIDTLNAAWGNAFWSMTYGYVRLSQVQPLGTLQCTLSPDDV